VRRHLSEASPAAPPMHASMAREIERVRELPRSALFPRYILLYVYVLYPSHHHQVCVIGKKEINKHSMYAGGS
jgi:hypothetical protein